MDTILLPGLFSEITSFLDDASIANLKKQSTAVNRLLTKEESQGYWKNRSMEKSKIPLPELPVDIDFDWKRFYMILQSTTPQSAIIATYPKTELLNWLLESLGSGFSNTKATRKKS